MNNINSAINQVIQSFNRCLENYQHLQPEDQTSIQHKTLAAAILVGVVARSSSSVKAFAPAAGIVTGLSAFAYLARPSQVPSASPSQDDWEFERKIYLMEFKSLLSQKAELAKALNERSTPKLSETQVVSPFIDKAVKELEDLQNQLNTKDQTHQLAQQEWQKKHEQLSETIEKQSITINQLKTQLRLLRHNQPLERGSSSMRQSNIKASFSTPYPDNLHIQLTNAKEAYSELETDYEKLQNKNNYLQKKLEQQELILQHQKAEIHLLKQEKQQLLTLLDKQTQAFNQKGIEQENILQSAQKTIEAQSQEIAQLQQQLQEQEESFYLLLEKKAEEMIQILLENENDETMQIPTSP